MTESLNSRYSLTCVEIWFIMSSERINLLPWKGITALLDLSFCKHLANKLLEKSIPYNSFSVFPISSFDNPSSFLWNREWATKCSYNSDLIFSVFRLRTNWQSSISLVRSSGSSRPSLIPYCYWVFSPIRQFVTVLPRSQWVYALRIHQMHAFCIGGWIKS